MKYCCDIRKVLRNKYDLIHIHKNSAANIVPFIIARNAAIISHSHNTAPAAGGGGRGVSEILHRINQNYLWKASCCHLACSQEAGKWLYGNRGPFTVIKNGIDTKRFRFKEDVRIRRRKQLGLEDRFVLGHVGRMEEQKNHKFLVEVFKEVARKDATAKLLLIGKGRLEDKIHQLVDNYQLTDRVIFAGVTDVVEEYMCAMDVFVLPSYYEGLPVAGIEAQASGLPCVVSDVVPEEAKLTDSLEFVPLKAGASVWAEKILQYYPSRYRIDREDACREVKDAGYDIADTAKMIQKLYRKCLIES